MWQLADSRFQSLVNAACPGPGSVRFAIPGEWRKSSNGSVLALAGILTTGLAVAATSALLVQPGPLARLMHADSFEGRAFASPWRHATPFSHLILPPHSASVSISFQEARNAPLTSRPDVVHARKAALASRSLSHVWKSRTGSRPRIAPTRPTSPEAPGRSSAFGGSSGSRMSAPPAQEVAGALPAFGSRQAEFAPSKAPLPASQPLRTSTTSSTSGNEIRADTSSLRLTGETSDTEQSSREWPQTATLSAHERGADLAAGTAASTHPLANATVPSSSAATEAHDPPASAEQNVWSGQPVQTSRGVEFAVRTNINGVKAGSITLLLADTELNHPQYVADNISVRLGDIVGLLAPLMRPEVAAWLNSSAASQQHVTLNDLRSHGILVSFDDDDRLVFKTR